MKLKNQVTMRINKSNFRWIQVILLSVLTSSLNAEEGIHTTHVQKQPTLERLEFRLETLQKRLENKKKSGGKRSRKANQIRWLYGLIDGTEREIKREMGMLRRNCINNANSTPENILSLPEEILVSISNYISSPGDWWSFRHSFSKALSATNSSTFTKIPVKRKYKNPGGFSYGWTRYFDEPPYGKGLLDSIPSKFLDVPSFATSLIHQFLMDDDPSQKEFMIFIESQPRITSLRVTFDGIQVRSGMNQFMYHVSPKAEKIRAFRESPWLEIPRWLIDVFNRTLLPRDFLFLDGCGGYQRGPDLQCFSDLLSINHTLKKLDMSRCRINNYGAATLALGLSVNKTLEKLCLSNNYINCIGAMALAKSLEYNLVIKHIDVSNNEIGPEWRSILSDLLAMGNLEGRRSYLKNIETSIIFYSEGWVRRGERRWWWHIINTYEWERWMPSPVVKEPSQISPKNVRRHSDFPCLLWG